MNRVFPKSATLETCRSIVLLTILTFLAPHVQPADAPSSPHDLAKNFVSLLVKEDYTNAVASFDAAMKQALPASELQKAWQGILAGAGEFQKFSGTRLETMFGYRIVFVGCEMKKSGITAKVVLNLQDKIGGLFFLPGASVAYTAPTYADTNLFTEKDMIIGKGKWELPGTLSLPRNGGPHPAIVLVHGSGSAAGDRDESIGPNKPFRDLAWGLASKGIAVLRYEKRTKHYAAQMALQPGITVNEETVQDAASATDLLRNLPEIQRKKVFLLGHSLGGTVAPRIAQAAPKLAGLIILAGASRPLEDLVLEQATFQLARMEKPSAADQGKLDQLRQEVATVKRLTKDSDPKALTLGAPASYWLDLQAYDPVQMAKDLPQPILVLQGEADCQVNPKLDLAGWQKLSNLRSNVDVKSFPGLNHLFMQVDGQSTGQEYSIASNVDPSVIQQLADWISKH